MAGDAELTILSALCTLCTLIDMGKPRVVDVSDLRSNWKAELKAAADGDVLVVSHWGDPEAVLVPLDVWKRGRREVPVEEMFVGELPSRDARTQMRQLRESVRGGRHVAVTVWGEVRGVLAPYRWAVVAFPEMELVVPSSAPSRSPGEPVGRVTVDGPECAMVTYRGAARQKKLEVEFAGATDPEWEMDRRLSAGPARVPADRRARLRAVVVVIDGVVARVRAVDPDGEWVDVEGTRHSLAPLSAPLSRAEIDERFPTLRVYPGDERRALQGSPREYLQL
ncbi:hypothetical protein [Nocardia abscessus]|uniref:hypothetical protein n=2 Tax=Nocardia TaxID=1817 RepID=UPI0024559519|nr:hypothetical protein [Nocardia abscessus]